MGIEARKSSQHILDETQGFLTAAVGRKVTVTYPTTSTEVYTFTTSGTTNFVITLTYSDAGTKLILSTAERTS